MAELSIYLASVAGLLSFFSPCILPIIPGFMAYISGRTEKDIPTRAQTFFSSAFFVLGFSSVFAILGVLLNTTLSSVSYDVRVWLGRIGGLIIIMFALQVLGLLQIPFLMGDHRLEIKKYKSRYITAFIFGAAFAVGWSPCVGAILGSIFALAVTQPASAFGLLLAYALGLGFPFLLVGLFTNQLMGMIKKSRIFLKYFNIVVGILLLILGVLVFTDNLSFVAYYLVPSLG